MSKQFDNKKLLYIFTGLLIILVLTMVIRIPKEKATLKGKLIEFDTTDVSKIVIYPKLSKDGPVEFNRNNGKWTVQQGQIISAPRKDAVQNIFSEMAGIKPQSLAAKSKSKWAEFELTDSLATRVKVLSKKGKTLADLMVGKFSYKEVSSPYGGYGSNNVQGTSFVRIFNETEVFAVEGFLSFSFNGNFSDWRDKSFISSSKNDITNFTFTYPADTGFVLSKKESKWISGIQPVDSSTVEGYLNSLSSLTGDNIKDNFKPVVNPVFQLAVTGNNLLNFTVKCYKEENSDEYILNSSQNPDVFFTSLKNGLFEKIFKSKSYFTRKK